MKIAVVTCYDQNDYVRARTLRTAFKAATDVEVTIIRNEHTGLRRYIEVPLKLLHARFKLRSEVYVVTFRGYEMLLFLSLTFVRKPIIFDEMINMTESFVEHHKIPASGWRYQCFRHWYAWLARHARYILADTAAHAEYSASLNHLPVNRYRTIPIGADEAVFHPVASSNQVTTKPFIIFYYGHMLPLHGLTHLLAAALILKDETGIHFRFVGGKSEVAEACAAAAAAGAQVSHEAWLAFDKIPEAAREAGLCIGGPFGDTLQSQFVITGKTYQFMAMARPVLIGRNQVNQLFRDRQNCLLVPQADAAALAETIRWSYHHQSQLAEIGQAGYELYQRHFSQTVINKSVAELVETLSKQSSTRQ